MCQVIKKDPQIAHIPVILLTARTQKADISKGLIYGADVYLTKPFDEVELLFRIDNLLSIKEKGKAQILEVQPSMIMSDNDTQFLDKLQNKPLLQLITFDYKRPIFYCLQPNYPLEKLVCKSVLKHKHTLVEPTLKHLMKRLLEHVNS